MSESHSYPLELLRAELKAALADQLVTLVDRFASKQELATFRGEQAAQQKENEGRFVAIDHKLDQLLAEKHVRDGAQTERRRLLEHRWAVVSLVVLAVSGALSGIAAFVLH